MKHLVSHVVQRRSPWFAAALLASSVLISACGGKSSGPPIPLTGQFLDGPVEGLRYQTATQSGTTNANGEFKYLPGESVTFSIGSLNLPSVLAAAVLTPVDVAGTQDLNDAKLTNLLVLLQSLDQDANTANGIRVPATVATVVTGASATALAQALQTASAAAFSSGTALRTVLDATVGVQRSVVAASDAIDHFAQTLTTARPTAAFVTRSSVVKADPQAPDLGFDRPVRLRFEGLKLASGVTALAQGACASVALAGSPTETSVEFTCTPSTTGPLTVTVMNGSRMLHTYTGTVPEPQVKLVTSLGELTLELNAAKAPITSRNFLRYVADGYYAGTVFHRVISNFMVQGGGLEIIGSNLVAKDGTYDPIVLERTTTTGLSNVTGTVAMARTNAENSATSQFFINVVDNHFLDATNSTLGYAVFGRVVEGADTTLQSLRSVQVRNNGTGEVSLPLSPPSIVSATRIR